MRVVWIAVAVGSLLVAGARAQSTSGEVDTRPGTRAQIERLESVTRGDVPPGKMTVYLRWLADLYVSIGDLDGAQRSYERLLDLYTYDLGSANLFAGFLLDHRRDPAKAATLLEGTIGWATKADVQPLYLGQTYSLYARALHDLGRHDEALEASNEAMKLLDPDAAENAMRTQAMSLKALGQRDRAADALERVIGMTGGANADDINALIAIETEKKGSIDAKKFRARIHETIAKARKERAESIRHEGAEMIELEGEGDVRLEGTLRRGKSPRAVLFVPELGGHRSAYTPYAQLLALEGYTTLTLDPRGHGDSRSDSLPSFMELSADHRALIPSDITAGQRYLRDKLKIPADRIAVIAAGTASADVEYAMHGLNLAAIVVHLSPIFDPLDRDIAAAIEFRPPLPALMVVSDEDVYSVQSVNTVRDAHPSDLITVRTVRSSGHGVTILHQPENFAMITAWLAKALD